MLFATARLVTDDTHIFGAKSILVFIMSRWILIKALCRVIESILKSKLQRFRVIFIAVGD